MDAHFWWTMATRTLFGLWFVALVVLFTARGGSYSRKRGSEERYVPPPQYGVFALLLTASFVWMACILWSTSERWAMMASCSLLGLIFLLLLQPYTLQVNVERRTYRLTRGWPFLRRHWSGSLNDVVRLRTVYAKGDIILIASWRKPGPRAVRIGSYKTRREAEAAATQVQEAWGISVPVVREG